MPEYYLKLDPTKKLHVLAEIIELSLKLGLEMEKHIESRVGSSYSWYGTPSYFEGDEIFKTDSFYIRLNLNLKYPIGIDIAPQKTYSRKPIPNTNNHQTNPIVLGVLKKILDISGEEIMYKVDGSPYDMKEFQGTEKSLKILDTTI